MRPFELAYLVAEPFLSPLLGQVRKRLLAIAGAYPDRPDILDVGGRKSHYTIGVPAAVTITDLPRETPLQQQLNLGVTQRMIQEVYARRSNVQQFHLDDMTHSFLPENSVDCIVAVEVLEHVAEDALFVREVYRVLKPGGTFLMTTPNGDFVRNNNPDHKRHYRREQLHSLLSTCLANVEVVYAIRGGVWYCRGLKSWSVRHPWRTLSSMVGNFITAIYSRGEGVKQQAHGTQHLIAVARKPKESDDPAGRSGDRVKEPLACGTPLSPGTPGERGENRPLSPGTPGEDQSPSSKRLLDPVQWCVEAAEPRAAGG